tara:strand:+ start:3278 stop:3721 length:444 start_codon:yes stop_codon:yes gene_type:complete
MDLKSKFINYNDTEKSIKIKDNFKNQYWLTNVMAILNIINSILFPVFVLNRLQMKWFGFFWILIGIASLVGLLYHIIKRSPAENLKIEEIQELSTNSFIGRKQYGLRLINGKFRPLIALKNKNQIVDTIVMIRDLGIPITEKKRLST